MANLRLFVACELPDEARGALARVQDDLRRLAGDRFRMVRPGGIHITLKFLGNVDEQRVGSIAGALGAAIQPFQLRVGLGSLGSFGGKQVRVVWVGLEGDVPGLIELADAVEGALQPLGFPGEQRPFAPHITLARVPENLSPAQRRELPDLLARYQSPSLPSMTLSAVALMRSHLGRAGARYERLASFPGPPS